MTVCQAFDILDVTCGGRQLWNDKDHQRTLYVDRRREPTASACSSQAVSSFSSGAERAPRPLTCSSCFRCGRCGSSLPVASARLPPRPASPPTRPPLSSRLPERRPGTILRSCRQVRASGAPVVRSRATGNGPSTELNSGVLLVTPSSADLSAVGARHHSSHG